jgi:hypothetical protein
MKPGTVQETFLTQTYEDWRTLRDFVHKNNNNYILYFLECLLKAPRANYKVGTGLKVDKLEETEKRNTTNNRLYPGFIHVTIIIPTTLIKVTIKRRERKKYINLY